MTPRPAPELAAVYQDPEALFLYYYLRDHFGGKETFQVPNAMAEALGMGRRKFAAARSRLEQYQAIWMVRLPCDRHGAALYRWRDRTAGASTCRLLYPSNTHSVEAGQF